MWNTKNSLLAGVTALGMLGGTAANAALLDFDSVPVGAYASHTEEGFQVTNTLGDWRGSGFGNPSPSIYATTPSASVEVVAVDGGLFTLDSLDLTANNLGSTFEIFGEAGSDLAFFFGGALNLDDAQTTWDTILNPFASVAIEKLIISFGVAGTSVNIDNINVQSLASVPAPATLLLLAAALVGMGAARRKLV
ncbi:PEP-CTERM sorting domain-containing protein [Corallincola luteus]|uniref:PEP-CTERM sorting domain-containing protein n=1 Tax=Corallincola luteus TaxID=1775177 RepID=A0ABY2AKK9_9GAMM|nr:PEP-CTERM sorting domain-containing protein [Corallincola luteus]TCI01978.1 PEP-CTERM sorting domain-containing protein [Corallincola luteus]